MATRRRFYLHPLLQRGTVASRSCLTAAYKPLTSFFFSSLLSLTLSLSPSLSLFRLSSLSYLPLSLLLCHESVVFGVLAPAHYFGGHSWDNQVDHVLTGCIWRPSFSFWYMHTSVW